MLRTLAADRTAMAQPADRSRPTTRRVFRAATRHAFATWQGEELALAESTAFTCRAHTCYAFQTAAGPATFAALLEERMVALVAPDFADEEARREVFGVIQC